MPETPILFRRGEVIEQKAPTYWEVVKGATYLSTLSATWRTVRLSQFAEDPDFDPVEYAKERGGDHLRYLEMFPDDYIRARSRLHFDALVDINRKYEQIAKDLDNATLGQYGATFLTYMLVDPVSWVPLIGTGYKLGKGAATAANLARFIGREALSTGLQVGALNAASEALVVSATPGMSDEEVLASALLGFGLGAAFGGGATLARSIGDGTAQAIFRGIKAAREMKEIETTLSTSFEYKPQLPGNDPKGYWRVNLFKGPIATFFEHYDPEGRLINSPFQTARLYAGNMFSHSLITKAAAEGIAPAPEGTIEDLFHTYMGILHSAIDPSYQLYNKWLTGSTSKYPQTKALVMNDLGYLGLGPVGRTGVFAADWQEMIARVLDTGQPSKIPEVNEAANFYRMAFEKLYELGSKAGVISGKIENYFPRLIDDGKVRENMTGFIRLAQRQYKKFLQSTFYKKLNAVEEAAAKKTELAETLADTKALEKTIAVLEKRLGDKFETLLNNAPTLKRFVKDFISPRTISKKRISRLQKEIDRLDAAIRGLSEDLISNDGVELISLIEEEVRQLSNKKKYARGELKRLKESKRFLRRFHKYIREQLRGSVFRKQITEMLSTEGWAKTLQHIRELVGQADAITREASALLDTPEFVQLINTKRQLDDLVRIAKPVLRPSKQLDQLARKESIIQRAIDNILDDITTYVSKRTSKNQARLLGEIKRALLAADNLDQAEELINELAAKKKSREAAFIRRVWKDVKKEYKADLEEAYLDLAEVRRKLAEWDEKTISKRRAELVGRLKEEAKKAEDAAKLKRDELKAEIKEALRVVTGEPSLKPGDYPTETEVFDDAFLDKVAEAIIANRSVDEVAELLARRLAEKISTATTMRGLQFLMGPRKSELSRILFRDVPYDEIKDFIIDQADIAFRAYVRTVLPDILLKERFGSVRPDKILEELSNEYNFMLKQLQKKLKGDQLRKAESALRTKYEQAKKDIIATWDRIRGVRGYTGAAGDPNSRIYAIAEILNNYETTTKMGRVLLPSLMDPIRIGYRTGLYRNLKTAFDLFLGDLKGMKDELTEMVRSLGVIESNLALRSDQLGAMLEEGLTKHKLVGYSRNLARKFTYYTGLVSWTQRMKELAYITTMAEFNDLIIQLAKHGKTDNQRLERVLINNGIDREMAKRIISQFDLARDAKRTSSGVFFPDPRKWEDRKAADVYTSFIRGEVERKIVTPGLDRPLWTDANAISRLLYKFRGYNIAYTKKILASGLQDPSVAFLLNLAEAVALGYVVMFLRGLAIGGDYLERMMEWDNARWFDEAFDVAGVLGVMHDVNRFLGLLGGVAPLSASFWLKGSKERTSRWAGTDALLYLLGPVGGTVKNTGQVLSDVLQLIGQGDKIDPATVHALLALVPFRTHLLLGPGFTVLEELGKEAVR